MDNKMTEQLSIHGSRTECWYSLRITSDMVGNDPNDLKTAFSHFQCQKLNAQYSVVQEAALY